MVPPNGSLKLEMARAGRAKRKRGGEKVGRKSRAKRDWKMRAGWFRAGEAVEELKAEVGRRSRMGG